MSVGVAILLGSVCSVIVIAALVIGASMMSSVKDLEQEDLGYVYVVDEGEKEVGKEEV